MKRPGETLDWDDLKALSLRLKGEDTPVSELRTALQRGSILIRAQAIDALAHRARHDDTLVADLAAAVADPHNTARLMGTIAVSHVAMARLVEIATPPALAAARQFVDRWPEPDRSDLLWFLRSEGCSVDALTSDVMNTKTGDS